MERGDRRWHSSRSCLLCFWLYHWKSGHAIPFVGSLPAWLNPDPSRVGTWFTDRTTLLDHRATARPAQFLLHARLLLVIVVFGIRRIRRRRTPYVKWQTLTLMAIQLLPLFILPEILLPYLGANGVMDHGAGLWLKTPSSPAKAGGARTGWCSPGRCSSTTGSPPRRSGAGSCSASFKRFVAIPAMVYFWGKGAYCGWICSCGALAETLGDTHRHKMPHGPGWKPLQPRRAVVLAVAAVLMLLRIAGWIAANKSMPPARLVP
jgi:hypothetical protein